MAIGEYRQCPLLALRHPTPFCPVGRVSPHHCVFSAHQRNRIGCAQSEQKHVTVTCQIPTHKGNKQQNFNPVAEAMELTTAACSVRRLALAQRALRLAGYLQTTPPHRACRPLRRNPSNATQILVSQAVCRWAIYCRVGMPIFGILGNVFESAQRLTTRHLMNEMPDLVVRCLARCKCPGIICTGELPGILRNCNCRWTLRCICLLAMLQIL